MATEVVNEYPIRILGARDKAGGERVMVLVNLDEEIVDRLRGGAMLQYPADESPQHVQALVTMLSDEELAELLKDLTGSDDD